MVQFKDFLSCIVVEVKDLINLVETATYLDDSEKKTWLDRISVMSIEQLKEFAGLMLSIEDQKANLEKENTLVVAGVASMFTTINDSVVKEAKKDAYKISENVSNKEEANEMESILKQMNDA